MSIVDTDPRQDVALNSGLPGRIRRGISSAREKWELPSGQLFAVVTFGVLLSWHIPVLAPSDPGGDHDFFQLINLAFERKLSFGSSIFTTYGPFFFLAAPSIGHPLQIIAAYVFWLFISVPMLIAIVQSLCRDQRSKYTSTLFTVVGLMSLAATPLSAMTTSSFVLVTLICILAMRDELPKWMTPGLPYYLAVVVALLVGCKFSVGAMAGLVSIIAITFSRRRWKSVSIFVGTGIFTFALAWAIVGQSLADILKYIWGSLQVGQGQSGAMGLELSETRWEYLLLLLAIVVTFIAVYALIRPHKWEWIFVATMVLAGILIVKQGFVRHDSHSAQAFCFFAMILLVAGARLRNGHFALVGTLLTVAQIAIVGGSLTAIDPVARFASFSSGVNAVVSPSYVQQTVDNSMRSIRDANPLPPEFIAQIGNAPVYAEPFNWGVSQANGLNDAIIPTLLEYGAYNKALDTQTAAWMRSKQLGPAFILRHFSDVTLDGRNPLWDSPRQKIAEVCNFRPVKSQEPWTLLQRSDNQCGALVSGESVSVAANAPRQIPGKSGCLTVVKVVPARSLLRSAMALALKPDFLYVGVDGKSYRLPWGHTGAPLIVSGVTYNSETVTREGKSVAVSVSTPAVIHVEYLPLRKTTAN